MLLNRDKMMAIWQLLGRLSDEKTNVKLHFLLLRNKKILEPEVKTLEETVKVFNEAGKTRMEPYETARVVLCEKFSDKEEDGTVKIDKDNNEYVMSKENKEKFVEELKALREENVDNFEEENKAREEIQALVQEEIEIDLVLIPETAIPETLELSGAESEILFELVKE